jgi:hypothetical protein
VDIVQAADGLRQHFEAFIASAKEKLEEELPVIGGFAEKTAANPAFAALASAVHLPEAPEALAALADLITKWDSALGAAKAAGAAEAQAAAAAQAPGA